MAKFKLQGHASGTGVFTLSPPNSSTDRTITLPDSSGALLTDASTIGTSQIAADAVTGAKIADDAIDSEHYTDGSIDTAHIADDAVTADKLANSINSEIAANTAKVTNATHTGEVTGATALTIADDVVDEANLKISNAGSNGQFLSKQSGNTGGLTWADAGGAIPSGTVMAFFQSSAPTGWTQVTTQNDKFLRVVSGTGGGTGGSAAASSPAHSLSAGSHTLSTSEIPSHNHGGVVTGGSSQGIGINTNYGSFLGWISSLSTGNTSSSGGGGSHSHSLSGSITTPQYIDVIICSYD